jgi:hypothetical protein
MLLQLPRGADEGRDIVADHLRDDRAASRVLGDGGEDVRIKPRIGQHPEIFGEINVRVAVTADQAHEAQVRDILHRRERKDGSVAAQQKSEIRDHRSEYAGLGIRWIGGHAARVDFAKNFLGAFVNAPQSGPFRKKRDDSPTTSRPPTQ